VVKEYDKQAQDFLEANKLRFAARRRPDGSPPPWATANSQYGFHYKVTIARKNGGSISFSFWDSVANKQNRKSLTAYDVLSCLACDINCPETFKDFCDEFGLDSSESDFRRCNKFAVRLRKFFTKEEISQLEDIR
jgi:hypothetical protein